MFRLSGEWYVLFLGIDLLKKMLDGADELGVVSAAFVGGLVVDDHIRIQLHILKCLTVHVGIGYLRDAEQE